MSITTDILDRRAREFLVWSPGTQSQAPRLVIGELTPGNPPTLVSLPASPPLSPVPGLDGLWALSAAELGLADNHVYHYWFEVDDSRSGNPPGRVCVTDPFACSVDWRVCPPGARDCTQPAAVIAFRGGALVESDAGGERAELPSSTPLDALPPNSQLVIYELPTAWALSRFGSSPERDTATFLDVAALVDEEIAGANFAELDQVLGKGKSYLSDLGVNALELLPPADSFFKREWGYDTSHYLAPDAELGYPEGDASPTANRDLATLVASLHRKRMRFFIDAVIAFAREDPYNHLDSGAFHIDDPSTALDDPDAWTSGRADGSRQLRDGFGSTLWRYASRSTTYDPISGSIGKVSPAAQFMLAYLSRWMRDFQVDGLRIDSVENVANWEFLTDFKNRARGLWNERWQSAGLGEGADERFLVVGEELTLPMELLRQNVIDGLWNEDFQSRVRAAILGENTGGDDFEWTVRKAIDPRLIGFSDGAQIVNYVTKHDVEGFRHERLFTMLRHLPDDQIERRIKLAFVCLLTAVGIPMFLAGEEFADRHDLFDEDGNVSQGGGKQIDPVNYSRLLAQHNPNLTREQDEDGWYGDMRRRILAYVKTLVRFRTHTPALSANDTDFIWSDFGDGKRVLAWRRGRPADVPVIVLANFSDFGSAPLTDYRVPTWPGTPTGKKWVEITQQRDVNPAFVGREAIFPWEAKVYTLRDT